VPPLCWNKPDSTLNRLNADELGQFLEATDELCPAVLGSMASALPCVVKARRLFMRSQSFVLSLPAQGALRSIPLRKGAVLLLFPRGIRITQERAALWAPPQLGPSFRSEPFLSPGGTPPSEAPVIQDRRDEMKFPAIKPIKNGLP
jgi:hypothetical protein